jgi:DNA gyrase/topoisomerase IV subunit B
MMRDAEGGGTHLAYYREYFARKLSHRHKQEAQQKYAESIIRESDLGQDIAGVIASFL